jgi:type I restriction enzyme M protein
VARKTKNETAKDGSGARLGFEEKLWAVADKMRSYMDPAEYKHVVLGLIFLKYISDAFEEKREQLELFSADPSSDLYVEEPELRYGVLEDRDEYLAENTSGSRRKRAGAAFRRTPSNRRSGA